MTSVALRVPWQCRYFGHAWQDVEPLSCTPAATICRERCTRCPAERVFDQQDYH